MGVTEAQLDEAARVIASGGVVAFPTETVYGLGANALDEDAVRRVFALKGRPATNPLIVHVRGIAHARIFARAWPARAHELALAHWPGPLTIVVPKSAFIPDAVAGGGPTVGLRVPANRVARALIERASVPIVGPSANPSGAVSPTTADHVREAFPDTPVLDDGPCETGIESTVVSFADDPPRVLRPGVLGHQELGVAAYRNITHTGMMPAPGLFASHYAPRARVLLVRGEDADIVLPDDAHRAARHLYAQLRAHDRDGVRAISVRMPTAPGPVWDAIRDRLSRAAADRG
ncbi:MAG: L-threonylcarbamoyladenylate synthase [Planctomycetota bacterium]